MTIKSFMSQMREINDLKKLPNTFWNRRKLKKAQKVLEVRSSFPNSSLADLYNPLTMPPTLIKAHNDLDKAVDSAYRTAPFTSEANRMVYLFELYEKYTADLFTKEKSKKKK